MKKALVLFGYAVFAAVLAASCPYLMAADANVPTREACDFHILTTLQMLTKLSEMALASQTLTTDELRAAYSATPFRDPMRAKTSRSDNAGLQSGFARAITRVRSNDLEKLREHLNAVLQTADANQAIAQEAKALTRKVVNPHVISQTAPGTRLPGWIRGETSDWHRDASGRLQWVLFDRNHHTLNAYSPDNATAPLWSEPIFQTTLENYPEVTQPSGQSLPGGEYMVAFTLTTKAAPLAPAEERPIEPVYVYSHNAKKSEIIKPGAEVLRLKLVTDKHGSPYLVLVTRSAVQVYELPPSGPRLLRTIAGAFTEVNTISAGSEVAVSAVTADGRLLVFKPLVGENPIGDWAAPENMKWATGRGGQTLYPLVRPSGQVLVAVYSGEGPNLVSVYDTGSALVRSLSVPRVWPVQTSWHENDQGEPMLFFPTHNPGLGYELHIVKPLKGAGPALADETKLSTNTPDGFDMATFVRSPQDGRELMVIPSIELRPGGTNFPNLRVYDLATYQEVVKNPRVPLGRYVRLFSLPATAELLAAEEVGSEWRVYNLLDSSLVFRGSVTGRANLPIAQDENGRAILAVAAEASTTTNGLTFIDLTDYGPEAAP